MGGSKQVLPNQKELLRHRTILSGSIALNISLLAIALGGALFWAIAARKSSNATVGQVATLTSSINFLILLSAFSLVPFVVRYGSGATRIERVIFNRVLLISSLFSGAGALIIAIISSVTNSETFRPIESFFGGFIFTAVAIGSAFTAIIEARLLRQKRYKWIVGRSVITSGLNVGVVALSQTGPSSLTLFVAAVGLTAISGPIIWLATDSGVSHRFAIRQLPDIRGEIIPYLSVSWTSSLLGRGAFLSIPLFVAWKVGSVEYSRFFIAWNIAVVMYSVVQNVGATLLADGGRTTPLENQTRHALLLASTLALVMIVATHVCTPLIQPVFGDEYGGSVNVLRILSLVAAAMAVYSVANAVAQVRGIPKAMFCLPLVMTVGIYLPLVIMSQLTIVKAAVALLIGTTIAGAVGATLLFVVRDQPFTPALLPADEER